MRENEKQKKQEQFHQGYYNLVTTNHLDEFLAFSEDYIEDQTAHYACAISALYACAAYYGALNFADVSGDYLGLWEACRRRYNL